jgi:hypothetical protein
VRCATRPAARSPYIRLSPLAYVRIDPLAYVTGRRPRGSIGSPLGRGAEPYMMGSRHVPAPDPCLAFGQGLSNFRPRAPGPHRERFGPLAKGTGSHLRGLVRIRGGLGPPLGVLPANLGALPWGSRLTADAQEYSTMMDTWRSRSYPSGEAGRRCVS